MSNAHPSSYTKRLREQEQKRRAEEKRKRRAERKAGGNDGLLDDPPIICGPIRDEYPAAG